MKLQKHYIGGIERSIKLYIVRYRLKSISIDKRHWVPLEKERRVDNEN